LRPRETGSNFAAERSPGGEGVKKYPRLVQREKREGPNTQRKGGARKVVVVDFT